jgi:hypothetical protein
MNWRAVSSLLLPRDPTMPPVNSVTDLLVGDGLEAVAIAPSRQ